MFRKVGSGVLRRALEVEVEDKGRKSLQKKHVEEESVKVG